MNIQQIKTMRVGLDEKVKLFEALKTYNFAPGKAFGKNAQEALLLARMWMGKLLGVIGEPSPHPNSMKPDNNIVDPPADAVPHAGYIANESGNTAKAIDKEGSAVSMQDTADMVVWVKMQRLDVDETINEWLKIFARLNERDNAGDELRFMCVERIVGYLIEAKLWLGMELEAQDVWKKEQAANRELRMRGEDFVSETAKNAEGQEA
jgi:hypothetical protein